MKLIMTLIIFIELIIIGATMIYLDSDRNKMVNYNETINRDITEKIDN